MSVRKGKGESGAHNVFLPAFDGRRWSCEKCGPHSTASPLKLCPQADIRQEPGSRVGDDA